MAAESLTCLAFAPVEPAKFVGRGEGARFTGGETDRDQTGAETGDATTCIDVADQIERKVHALAAYRTQYPLEPGMLPAAILTEMMGREYFTRVHPPRQLASELV